MGVKKTGAASEVRALRLGQARRFFLMVMLDRHEFRSPDDQDVIWLMVEPELLIGPLKPGRGHHDHDA
jgi:hypothetical protein